MGYQPTKAPKEKNPPQSPSAIFTVEELDAMLNFRPQITVGALHQAVQGEQGVELIHVPSYDLNSSFLRLGFSAQQAADALTTLFGNKPPVYTPRHPWNEKPEMLYADPEWSN
jgi:hypothetical protein